MALLGFAAEGAVALSQHGCAPLSAGSAWEQHFVRQVIELHDKYMLYVCGCFANSSLFHKALKEAFEFFCNKNVAGSSTAELMANFCDNLLRKVYSRNTTCICSSADHGAVDALYVCTLDVYCHLNACHQLHTVALLSAANPTDSYHIPETLCSKTRHFMASYLCSSLAVALLQGQHACPCVGLYTALCICCSRSNSHHMYRRSSIHRVSRVSVAQMVCGRPKQLVGVGVGRSGYGGGAL